jgi:hypothetical protein
LSPVADYFRTLESNLLAQNLPVKATRNVWLANLPVEDISYTFKAMDFANLQDSDKTAKTTKSTATTAQETGSDFTSPVTSVSAITEDMVSNTVKSSVSAFETRRKAADEASDQRMDRLEAQVGDITQQVHTMTTQIQNAIVQTLTEENGLLAKQSELIMGQLAGDIQDLLARNTARLEYTSGCSPDRKRQKEATTLNEPAAYQVAPPVIDSSMAANSPVIDSPMAEHPPEVPTPNRQ